jgi:hypothetical protein
MRVTKLTATWIDHCVVQPGGIARCNRALATIRSVAARIESAFAAFADIPYQDAPTQQEIVCLLEEFKVDYSAGKSNSLFGSRVLVISHGRQRYRHSAAAQKKSMHSA